MNFQYLAVAVVLIGGIYGSVRAKKLTLPAAATGGLIGLFIFAGAGFTGIIELAAFFISGSFATGFKKKVKDDFQLAEANEGTRTASQVFANAGVAAICGFLAWYLPASALPVRLMIAGSIAAAAGDTLSSELGNVYGRKFFNILTLRPDERGLNGVISLEGTLAGLAGSCLIALIFCIGTSRFDLFPWVAIGGLIGNLADSVLGATLERRHILHNVAVNFLNTLSGGLAAAALAHLTGY